MPESSFAILSPTLGTRQDAPSILLKDAFLPDALDDMKNFIFRYGEIHRSKGRAKEFTQALPDRVLHYYNYKLKNVITKYLLLYTKRDIAKRNSAEDRLDYLTPRYNTGKASFVNGDATVTFSNGASTATIKEGNFITIGTTYSTSDTWYEVLSITNDTELELTAEYIEANSGAVNFLNRITYTGDNEDFWESVTFNNKVISTNGVNNVQVWAASDRFADLAGGPPKGKHLLVYENYVTIANLEIDANDHPNKYAWCALGAETNWTTGDSGVAELDDMLPITACREYQGFWIMFTEGSIEKLWFIGGDLVWRRGRITTAAGAWAPKSVLLFDKGILFYSYDHTFRIFTGSAWPKISDPMDKLIGSIHPEYEKNIQAVFSEEYNLALFAFADTTSPAGNNNKVLTYDLKVAGVIDRWTPLDIAVSAFGAYEVETTYTWNTLPFSTWDTWGWDKWNTRFGFAKAPHLLAGDYSGYTFQMFAEELDDDSAYTGEFVLSTDLSKDKQMIGLFKRITTFKLIFRNEGGAGGTISVSAKRDYESGFHLISSTVSLSGSEDFLFIDVETDLTAKNFLFKISGAVRFRFLGMIFPEFEIQGWR